MGEPVEPFVSADSVGAQRRMVLRAVALGGAARAVDLCALVHNVDAVPPAVGHGEAQSDRHDDDGRNPQEVDRKPDEAKNQSSRENPDHDGVRASLLGQNARQTLVTSL